MADRVVVFVDYQNVYRSARATFHRHESDPHWFGQVNPLLLGRYLAADSPYDRALQEIRIYRGIPSSSRDPRGYSAARKQIDTWSAQDQVSIVARPLRYPSGWPTNHEPGERPQEKGIDVALALDFAVMGLRNEYDVGILMSLDTDLKPALERVAELTRAWGRPRAEVAAWSSRDQHNRRLSISGARLYCHWIDEPAYEAMRDDTNYAG